MLYIKFETRPEKPQSESFISFWCPSEIQKSSGKIAIQIKSRSGILRDHLTVEQVEELLKWLSKAIEEIKNA